MWGGSCAVAVSVLAHLKVKEAVMQQAAHVAEVADRTQTLQLLVQIALLPTAVASTHLQKRKAANVW